jgi:hydrogenase nickel incorporation protein HypA/HybF
MHELSLAQGIIDIAERRAAVEAFARVTHVFLRIGALAQVEPEALEQGFHAASRGTIAEGARLHIERPPGQGRCLGCGATVILSARGEPCPACESFQLVITGGDEMRVTELEVD